jgi:hypothetical protein
MLARQGGCDDGTRELEVEREREHEVCVRERERESRVCASVSMVSVLSVWLRKEAATVLGRFSQRKPKRVRSEWWYLS